MSSKEVETAGIDDNFFVDQRYLKCVSRTGESSITWELGKQISGPYPKPADSLGMEPGNLI